MTTTQDTLPVLSAKPGTPGRSLRRALMEPRTVDGIGFLPKVLSYGILLFWSFVVIGPLYWIAITSFKLPIQVNDGPDYLPFVDFEPSLHAWQYILVDQFYEMIRPFVNSLIVALSATAIATIVGACAAYALVRVHYRIRLATVLSVVVTLAATLIARFGGDVSWIVSLAIGTAVLFLALSTIKRAQPAELGNNDILFWILSNRILPPVVVVLPIYLMFQRIGLVDTYTALIITYVAVNLPIAIWLMRDFFATIPMDLEESAQIDGAHKLEVFWTIVLPLTKPRDAFVLSTKIGRLLKLSTPEDRLGIGKWFEVPSRQEVFDYTYNGVWRSIEFSLERTGLDRFDIIFAHDLDTFSHGSQEVRDHYIDAFMNGGYRALVELRDQGVIKALGAGVNE